MPAWPASLPREFERQGYLEEAPERLVRSRLRAAGLRGTHLPARREVAHPLRGTMLVTTAQWRALMNWYTNKIGEGALSFNFPKPDTDTETIPVTLRTAPRLRTIGGDLHAVTLILDRV